MKSSEHSVSGLMLSQSVDTELLQLEEKRSIGVAARTDCYNHQLHLPNVEHNCPPQNTFLLSRGIYRPPSNNPPRDTEVTCSTHLQTYGSVFFVLCSLYFIVFCIVIVRFRRFSLYWTGLVFRGWNAIRTTNWNEGTTHLNCARMGRTVLVLKRNHNHKQF